MGLGSRVRVHAFDERTRLTRASREGESCEGDEAAALPTLLCDPAHPTQLTPTQLTPTQLTPGAHPLLAAGLSGGAASEQVHGGGPAACHAHPYLSWCLHLDWPVPLCQTGPSRYAGSYPCGDLWTDASVESLAV